MTTSDIFSEKSKSVKTTSIILMLILIVLSLSVLVYALSFSTGPTINEGLDVYTEDDISCAWTNSADVMSVNVSWYKNGVRQLSKSGISSPTLLRKDNTTKGQTWKCEIILLNGTSTLYQNASVLIKNTAQIPPVFKTAGGSTIPQNYSLIEDTSYTVYINSTDADLDPLTYRVVTNGVCVVENEVTGRSTCRVGHEDITGSVDPSPETSTQKVIQLWADDNPNLINIGNNHTFTMVPQNDQAEFAETIPSASATADATWVYVVNGTDEETDFDLNFTMYSLLNETLVMTSINGSSVNLTFNLSQSAPTNEYVGNWTVYINVTDNESSNGTRAPAEMSFTLEINSINHNPEFVTNFTNTTGTQNQYFETFIYANDSDIGDTITFSVAESSGQSEDCEGIFPWTITTISNNGTNASGKINATLNNSHIDCRYIDVTITDQLSGSRTQTFFFNLTNVNDQLQIEEMSEDGSINNQTARLYVTKVYQLNITDPDLYTYDTNVTANFTYVLNDSNFVVNSSGAIIFTITNDSLVGVIHVNVTVNDSEYEDSRILNVTIIDNSAPILSIFNSSMTVNQNDNILINFSGLDVDNNTMNVSVTSLTSFNESIYVVETGAQTHPGGQNLQEWFINLSEASPYDANAKVGDHSIWINISDQYGVSIENISTGYVNVSILNENDAPFFDLDQNNENDSSINMGTVAVGVTYVKTLIATDFDLYLGGGYGESLSFNYSAASSGLENITLAKTGNKTASLTLVSTSNETQYLLLRVEDANGAYDVKNVSFSFLENSEDPIIHEVKPYYNDSLSETVFDFINKSIYSNNVTAINISENTTVVFDAIVTYDTTVSGVNYLNMEWYYDGELMEMASNVTSGVDSNYTRYFGFFDNGTHNITLVAVDNRSSSVNWTWTVNVSNVNRPPLYLGDLKNLVFNGTLTYANYFNYGFVDSRRVQKFYDPDDDPSNNGTVVITPNSSNVRVDVTSLSYGVYDLSSCSLMTFGFSGDDLSLIASETGTCFINFTATDEGGLVVNSRQIRIDATGVVPSAGDDTSSSSSGGSSTRTQVVTVPYEEPVEVPKPLNLLVPGKVDVYENRTIFIPIVLENTWEDVLRGVSLNASLTNDVNATYYFTQTYFTSIPFGGEAKTTLQISNYRDGGPFEIVIDANVGNPEFTDSASILINSIEQTSEGEEVRTKVTFAKDMLSENPECRELNDLLDRAEKAMEALDYKESLNLVSSVINGCKFLMNKDEIIRKETPSLIETSFDFMGKNADKIAMGAGIITFLTIIIYAIAGVRKLVESNEK